MKLVIIILLALLILGGGGGGYYYFFVLTADNGEPVEEEPPPPLDIRFVDMDPLRIPVIRNGAVVNYVVLKIALETIGPDNEALATRLIPRLTNNYITDLHGYFAIVSVEDRILVKAIKRRLQKIADRTMGVGIVNDILIENAFKQR